MPISCSEFVDCLTEHLSPEHKRRYIENIHCKKYIPPEGHALVAVGISERTIWINPSTSIGYYFVSVVDPISGYIDGTRCPVHVEAIGWFLVVALGRSDWEPDVEWLPVAFDSQRTNPWLDPAVANPRLDPATPPPVAQVPG